MKVEAAQAIADVVGEDVAADYIVPSPLDKRVAVNVATAVKNAVQEGNIVDGTR